MSDIGKYYLEYNAPSGVQGTALSLTVASISGATISFSGTPFGATNYAGYLFQIAGQRLPVSSNTSSALTLSQALIVTAPTPSFSTYDTGRVSLTATTTLIAVGTTYACLLYPSYDTIYDPNMGHPTDGRGVGRFCTICQVPYREDHMTRFRGLWYCKDDVPVAASIWRNEKRKAWTPPNRAREPGDSPIIPVPGPAPGDPT